MTENKTASLDPQCVGDCVLSVSVSLGVFNASYLEICPNKEQNASNPAVFLHIHSITLCMSDVPLWILWKRSRTSPGHTSLQNQTIEVKLCFCIKKIKFVLSPFCCIFMTIILKFLLLWCTVVLQYCLLIKKNLNNENLLRLTLEKIRISKNLKDQTDYSNKLWILEGEKKLVKMVHWLPFFFPEVFSSGQ